MLKVNSEINTLKKVLLHRPNVELNVLNENNKQEYLFDELPNLSIAQKEHDYFSKILKDNNVEVVYILDLMKDVLDSNNVKESFIKDYLKQANCDDEKIYNEFLKINDNKELLLNTFSGLNGKLQALPNLYFTRDPFTIIDNGIAIYNMHTNLRKRETIYGEYINKYHDDFKGHKYYAPNFDYQIEGGDVILLNKDIIAIGVSERTTLNAAKELSERLISNSIIKQSLIMEIPSKRACMHLDTVFTRFDENKFVIYKEIYDNLKLKLINEKGIFDISESIENTLEKLLNISDIKLLICDDEIEQWNDACNTLCIGPNKIIVYDINKKINKRFKELNTVVYELPSKELVKGRGGPHCMSMPLIRE